METCETNPDGYSLSAPINFAEGLKVNLLIIHGTGETNTHIQIVTLSCPGTLRGFAYRLRWLLRVQARYAMAELIPEVAR